MVSPSPLVPASPSPALVELASPASVPPLELPSAAVSVKVPLEVVGKEPPESSAHALTEITVKELKTKGANRLFIFGRFETHLAARRRPPPKLPDAPKGCIE